MPVLYGGVKMKAAGAYRKAAQRPQRPLFLWIPKTVSFSGREKEMGFEPSPPSPDAPTPAPIPGLLRVCRGGDQPPAADRHRALCQRKRR